MPDGGSGLKKALKRAKPAMRARVARRRFPGSPGYWQQRYEEGGNSGVGSYGDLATFKADVLNGFVRENRIQSVIEFGCGDGNQLALSEYPTYIGLDVAPAAIDRCRQRFEGDDSKSFMLYSTRHFSDPLRVLRADLAMSLDVLFHLVEDEVFHGYMTHLFNSADQFVVIYSSNHEGGRPADHVKFRVFTDWINQNRPSWGLVERVANPYRTTHEGAVADFYIYRRPDSRSV